MNIPALLAQLEAHEGFRSSAYQDTEGFWTIGIGRLIDKRKGGGISKAEALFLLENDVQRFTKDLDVKLPWWRGLSDIRQRVLADMAFQMGVPGLLAFKNTLRAVHEGRWADAKAGMLASKWAQQTPNRAQRLAQWMLTGEESK